MSSDVRDALEEHGVMADYEARPPYQRNDYIGWIERAARADTRDRRIAQMVDELSVGGVYMGMSHPPSSK